MKASCVDSLFGVSLCVCVCVCVCRTRVYMRAASCGEAEGNCTIVSVCVDTSFLPPATPTLQLKRMYNNRERRFFFFFLHLLWRSVLCNTCRSVSAYHQDASFIHMRIEKANLFLDSFLPPIIKKSYVESSFCKYSDLMLKSYSWKRSSLKAILQNFMFQEFPHFTASFLFPLVESVATPAHQV